MIVRKQLILLIIINLIGINYVKSARILCAFQMAAVSHHQVFQPIWRELSLRGHQVVVVTPYPLKEQGLINLTEIEAKENHAIKYKHGFEFFMNKQYGVHTKIPKIFDMNNDLAEAILKLEDFIKIYNDTSQKFDLVIAQTYVVPTLYGLAAKLKVPLIGVSSMDGFIGSHVAMGNPHHPAIYSEMFLPYHGEMTLYERFRSTLYNLWVRYYLTFEGYPSSDKIARKYLGNDLPYIEEIIRNMSLLFVTTNPILQIPRPTVPTVISLEHIHIKPAKPLPKDLKEFMDNSKKGVVYFSLGSNVRSINIPEKTRSILMETFAELPYDVLWKFENDSLPNLPKNVVINKWLPQQDVLGHANIKVFVTQCGLQSTEEAVARGIPIVGIPFIADQEMNAKRLEQHGVGLNIDFVSMTKEELKKTVIEVAENKKYRLNMKKLRDLWLDHPMKSLDRAIWWIEYVIRYNGTKHLHSPTADISWIQYLLLDIIFVLLCSIFVLFRILKCLVSLCFRKKEKQL